MFRTFSLFVAMLVLWACGTSKPAAQSAIPNLAHPRASKVLVVYNANAPESVEIVEAYKKARGIPNKNILAVRVTTEENIPTSSYESSVRNAVRDHIEKNGLEIDFLVMIRGMPLRLDNDFGYSLDAWLMVDAHPSRKSNPLVPMPMQNFKEEDFKRILNPYFNAKEPFDAKKYGFYLCTRLDGYTQADALALISRSIRAKPAEGEFLFDAAPDKKEGGYAAPQAAMYRAKELLEKKGFRVALDEGAAFIGGRVDLMGYASWGSNDWGQYKESLYRSLEFRPGGLAETFVSTSGRTFRPTTGGQSLVADLIQQGATGVKGYVSEPFTLALAYVDILFDRYTDGFTLAESFYAASMMLKWKDVVIGDPLCAPYAKGQPVIAGEAAGQRAKVRGLE